TRSLNRALDLAPYLPRALLLAAQASPSTTALSIGLLLVQGMLPLAVVYLTRGVVDSLVAALQSDDPALLRQTLLLALACAAVALCLELAGAGARWVRTAQAERIKDHVAGLIHERSVAVDLAFYESPAFYDRLHRARDESGDRSIGLLESLSAVTQTSIT